MKLIKRIIFIIIDFFDKSYKCDCVSCRFTRLSKLKGEPMIYYAYAKTMFDMYDIIIKRLKKDNIVSGYISDNDTLRGFLAQCQCNKDDIGCILGDKDMIICDKIFESTKRTKK